MKLYLASTAQKPYLLGKYTPLYVLESFYYVTPQQVELIPTWKGFLLDSGAFTFMAHSHASKGFDFDAYLDRYIAFIKRNNIKQFFELDVDSVVGYGKVLEMRRRLEKETGTKCIPVWHKSRGLEEWRKLTAEYSYVAIGGFVTKEIKPREYKFLPQLLKIARENGCKVHGLGFTNKVAYGLDLYSVDSSNWTCSSRYGGVEYFDGQKMVRVNRPSGKKNVNYKVLDEFILQEYIKFQKYLDKRG